MTSYSAKGLVFSGVVILALWGCSGKSTGGGGGGGFPGGNSSSATTSGSSSGDNGGSSSGTTTASSSGDNGGTSSGTNASSSSGTTSSSSSGTTGSSSSGATSGSSSGSTGTDGGLIMMVSAACTSCAMASCAAETAAATADPLSAAIVNCGTTSRCSGDCCYCNPVVSGKCDPASCNGSGMGPCATQINMAATGSPNAMCMANSPVQSGCLPSNTTNSCGKATAFGNCIVANCATQCNSALCM